MKALLRCLKNFWFALALVWAIGLLSCWFALPRWQFTPEQVYVAMTLFSAVCLLLIVLRQYRRIRAEQNIESLVQLEVDRSLGAEGEFRDQHVLRERLKHAIAMLRSARSAGGGWCLGAVGPALVPGNGHVGFGQDLAADPLRALGLNRRSSGQRPR